MLSQFHSLAASSDYLQALFDRFAANRDELPKDWRAVFELLEAYFPGVMEGASSGSTDTDFVRRFAHIAAQLDPLGRTPPARWNRLLFEFSHRVATMNGRLGVRLAQLLDIYAGPLAIETGHLDDPARADWIHAHRESTRASDGDTRRRALAAVVKGETFERFMAQRFVGKKRFGAEGAESLHALVQRVLDRAAAAGVEEVVIGTMHRGRLGLMAGILGQPLNQLFCGMKGQYPFYEPGRAADVTYHLGLVSEYRAPAGVIRIRVLPNPSHLEAINAVVLGYARNRQETLGSSGQVLPLILHTDASVVAQGVVSEALQFTDLIGHHIGGALNVIVNNQIGFTTDPDEARSSRHCTAAWKAVDSLIAHVNGDDVDAVLSAADLAFDYRTAFAGESVVDLVCTRANGHNEVDEPRFTQPGYYALSDFKMSIAARYTEVLLTDRTISPAYSTEVAEGYRTELEAAFTEASPRAECEPALTTSVGNAAPLDEIAAFASQIPVDGRFNAKAARLVAQRGEEWRSAVSWATAEVIALGATLSMGWNVRLTGQDVDRGAFSQRHLSLVDADSGARRRVFETTPDGWGQLAVFNTPLCEYASLSYEYGYSVAARKTLTVWEAQFGDFANGAQVVLDQFIASGTEKWDQRSGLVILLPHGLEGQGPEHSSGRIERMLQLAANDNLRVAHPSTPANYFHLLLSQLHQARQRPLVIFTPKKLLRLKAAASPPEEFKTGAFRRIITRSPRGRVRRVLLCSGKIYYDLEEALAQVDHDDIMIVRLEQLYPFPEAEVVSALKTAPNCEVVWVQEEPSNFGIWTWLRSRLEDAIAKAGVNCPSLRYLSRPESSSPAGSFHGNHERDQARLVAHAISRP